VTSPADGVVRDIELIRGDEEEFKELFKGRDMLRIGVFLSVFDVHINRAPCDMRVEFRRYKEGFFHDARDARASKENESLALGGVGRLGSVEFPVVVRQISGAIARRIVCAAQPGDQLARGFRYGMIKFGSRTELFLPAGKLFELEVKVGDRVFAGTSVMAKLVDPDAQPEGFTDTVPVVGIQKDEGPGR
jgi:phosphatidylserine decarboxylase